MISDFMITYGTEKIPIHVIRSARKSMAIQVKADGTVYARVPGRIDDRSIRSFINGNKEWIVRKRLDALSRKEKGTLSGIPDYDSLSTGEKQLIREKICEKVRLCSEIMGVSVGRITIRNQKTRWGSCSAKGNLNFNYRLYYMPEELLNYVVIHELSHRRYMNHSSAFWDEVERYCPDYRLLRSRLRDYSLW